MQDIRQGMCHTKLCWPQNEVAVTDIIKIKIKSVAYSSQGSHTGQLDFCNWLADGSATGG